MRVLGLETSCDDTGVAVYDSARGLLAHRLYSQSRMHAEYGGVVPELASRDHIRKLLPLVREVLAEAETTPKALQGLAYTQGPGLAGACALDQVRDRRGVSSAPSRRQFRILETSPPHLRGRHLRGRR